LAGYQHAEAETWQASVDQLSPEALALLERLCFLAPDPVPLSLLDMTGQGGVSAEAAHAAFQAGAEFHATQAVEPQAGQRRIQRDGGSRHAQNAAEFTAHGITHHAQRLILRQALDTLTQIGAITLGTGVQTRAHGGEDRFGQNGQGCTRLLPQDARDAGHRHARGQDSRQGCKAGRSR
jgi:hypothetical protein